LSSDYEAEQADLESKLEQWQAEVDEQEQHTEHVERFIRKCKQYIDLTELTPTILNDLVSKVFVDAPDKSDGKRKQNIHISYDLLGILPELNNSGTRRNGVAFTLRHTSKQILFYDGLLFVRLFDCLYKVETTINTDSARSTRQMGLVRGR